MHHNITVDQYAVCVLLTTLSYSCIVSAPYSSYPAGNRSWRYCITDVCVQVRGPWSMLPNVKKELKGAHQKLTRLEVSLSLLIILLQVR